jgi:hypothetical protein
VFAQTLQPSDALVSSTVAGHQMLVHRSVYETSGWYLLDSAVSDNEIHARFTQAHFYAFADRVTAEFRDHAGGQGRGADFPAAMRQMYAEVHPVAGRPIIDETRERSLAGVAAREPGKPPFEPTLRIREQ